MKKLSVILSAFLLLTAFTTLKGTWNNDKAHSQLGFKVEHLGISEISGSFNDFDVVLSSTKEDFSDASVELEARVASIDTRVEARDNHLRSPDFFNAEKFPTLHFKSTSLEKTGKNNYKLKGNLTLAGITRPVTMDLVYKGSVENPMNQKQTAGFSVHGVIKRSDFNLGSGFPPPMISDEVRIEAHGEFVQ